MKTHKHLFRAEEDFFQEQEKSILSKTTEMEAWRLNAAGNAEDKFPLPDGYFLSMEEGIRRRIQSGNTFFSLFQIGVWKPAIALSILISGICIYVFDGFNHEKTDETLVQTQIRQLDQVAVLEYLTENQENMEISQQYAFQQMEENQNILPAELEISAEELLDENLIDESDIENNL
jgi:hypothetical protein